MATVIMPIIRKTCVLLLAAVLIAGAVMALQQMSVAAYNPTEEACKTLTAADKAASAACSDSTPTENPVIKTIKNVTNVVAVIAGMVAVIMIIFYGMQLVSSGGDPQKVKSAKSGITYAIVGLIVIVLATPLIHFVINRI